MDIAALIIDAARQAEARGDAASAEISYRGLLENFPDNLVAAHRLGSLLFSSGRYEECLFWMVRAAGNDAASFNVFYDLGIVYGRLERYALSVSAYEKALRLKPEHGATWFKLGLAAGTLGRRDEARHAYGRAVDLARAATRLPDADIGSFHLLADALGSLGVLQGEAAILRQAADVYRQVIALEPAAAEAFCSFGTLLMELDLLAPAAQAYARAIAARPGFVEAYRNQGFALERLGRFEQAEAAFETAVSLAPDQPVLHFNLAVLKLLRGDYRQGWPGYERRWELKPLPIPLRNFHCAAWAGEDLAGRTILLHAEQGLGDSIQFLRYLPMVAAAGATIVLEVQRPLLRLAQSMGGIAHLVAYGDPLPAFDCHCPLLSLPLRFDTRLTDIPTPGGYLTADRDLRPAWAARLASGRRLKVGLVWAGSPTHANDRQRSIDFDELAPLWDCDGVQWYSLQVGPRADEVARAPAGRLIDLSPWLTDLAETAAAIGQLDLVVSVDTAVAHLAGALGHPCWIALAFTPEWRWLTERADSPWYSSVRLFRQTAAGDWQGPIRQIAAALSAK